MAVNLTMLLRHKYFMTGLVIRLIIILMAVPFIRSEWFLPFLHHSIMHPSVDPWRAFLQDNGSAIAFPYGTTMYLVFLPALLFGHLLNVLGHINLFTAWGMGLTILIIDYILLQLLYRITEAKINHIFYFYWLSPIVIFISYWHGQLDIVPITLLISSLYALKLGRARWAGFLLACAVSAKLSMLLAAPILLIYLWRNNRTRYLTKYFFLGLLISLLILQAPYLLSSGFITMVLQNPELNKVTLMTLRINEHGALYILPTIYTLFIYSLWRIERLSLALLNAVLGIGFCVILILTPASVGWYLWIVPFLVIYQIKSSSRYESLIIYGFYWLLTLYFLLFETGAKLTLFNYDYSQPFSIYFTRLPTNASSWGITIIDAMLGIFCLSMLIKGIRNNDYFRLSRRPLSVGISGDSGTGKDTLSNAIGDMFNLDSVSSVSGDDYHKWDRYAPMWKTLTHLDPRGNNLQQFTRDVIGLINGKNILARHYDHTTGRFSQKLSVEKNDVLLVSGLHVLYIPALRSRLDLKIYLRMDEELRQFFKMRRDVLQRGHTEERVRASMARRMPDAEAYLYPQAQHADIVFNLEPTNYELLADYRADVNISLRLRVALKDSYCHEDIIRYLVGVCGARVDTNMAVDGAVMEMIIDGDISPEDVALAAKIMVPHMDELLAPNPTWHGGMTGIMQLITLIHIAEKLHERLS